MITRSQVTLTILVLVFFSFSGSAHARAAKPLVTPEPAEWGCTLALSEVKSGIEAGMKSREWASAETSQGHITAKIIVRGKHTLIVDIDYTKSRFEIKYKDSKSLKYSVDSEGIKKIHPFASTWMENLKVSIVPELQRKCH